MERQPAEPHARRILEATTLEDKLAAWPAIDSRSVPTGTVPPLRRPPGLALPTGRRALPSIARVSLDHADGRARVLHELLNHELQAIELLAWAIVRWPEAPAGFRRALVATLRDEQRHCRLYADRLVATGGEVGQQPVSGFFWETLTNAPDPRAFVAGLSLCFESANLDYCQTWRSRFAAAGDHETAAVLQTVYDDEIRHVATGLVWFGRWTDGDRLQAWEDALVPPLTPARARGAGFDRVGRARAGYTPEEIERLRLMGGSRGRPPRVVWFDAGVEDRVAGRPVGRLATTIGRDLATLPMFLVGGEDVVVAPTPSLGFLGRLADAGFPIPRFVAELTSDALGPHAVRRLEPWGAVPEPDIPPVETLEPPPRWEPAWRALSSKVACAEIASSLQGPGWAPAAQVWTSPGVPPEGPWVAKAPFSTSGTARIRGHGALEPRQRAWLDKVLARDGAVVVQPWYTRVADVSLHLTIGAEGWEEDGRTRFQTAANGSYRGAWLGPWTASLPAPVKRAVFDRSGGRALGERLDAVAARAGQWAHELGYRGPISVDCALVAQPDGLAVAWLETNARRTLGRVALALGRHVDRRCRGFWHVARRTDALVAELADARCVRGEHGLLGGRLPTTDPATARAVLTWIEVEGEDATRASNNSSSAAPSV
jgi:uncharacterized ferritin-like protein (DUF455 family)